LVSDNCGGTSISSPTIGGILTLSI
jgi:hypothetical protein